MLADLAAASPLSESARNPYAESLPSPTSRVCRMPSTALLQRARQRPNRSAWRSLSDQQRNEVHSLTCRLLGAAFRCFDAHLQPLNGTTMPFPCYVLSCTRVLKSWGGLTQHMGAMHPDLLYSSNSEQPLLATGSPDPTDDGFDAALPPPTQGENDSGSDDSIPLLSDLLIKDSSDLEDGVQAGHNARSARPLPIFPSIHSSELEGSSNGAACLSPGVHFGPSQGTLYHSHSDEATSMPAPANQRDTPFLPGSENEWLFDMGRSPSVTERDALQATLPRNSSPYTAATSRLVHPAVNGKPCDSSGHTLPENAPARPPPTRDASDWTPYADHVAFELADLLYRREQMPASNVKSLLQLWAVGLVEHGGRPPFASVANMYNVINCTLRK
ncbi:hypothetical protein NUW54_g6911 [Trametes sanguinea]|uniref:Uncharacterized protein n=1 Tax=Trametes sanguinea TaxID=158606 RepID=A0ACC1PTM7_9APHY|nr:hypothetical protein NUW54_g6911 [Trametes sanguinea]